MALPLALALFLVWSAITQKLRGSSAGEMRQETLPPGDPTMMTILTVTAIIAAVSGTALAIQSRNVNLDDQRTICQSMWDSGPDVDDCVDIRSDIGSEGAKGILLATSAVNLGLVIASLWHRRRKLRELQGAKQAQAAQHARAIKQERLATVVENGIIARFDGAVAIGGSPLDLARGARYSVVFGPDEILVVPDSPSARPLPMAYETLAVAITGQGERTTNLGLWGGGFGVKGAAKGMLAASILNSLTTKTDIDTVIALSDATQELYFHYDKETPEDLRIRLAPVFVKLRANPAVTTESNSSLVTDLSRLVELRDSGALSEHEFVAAKERLLSRRNTLE